MNLGGPEILVIIVIGIMVLGPDKLPSALRMFGKTMGEIKKYQDLAKGEISKAMDGVAIESEPRAEPIEQSKQTAEPEEPQGHRTLDQKDYGTKEKQSSEEEIAPIVDEDN